MLKIKQIIPGVLAPLSFAVVSSVEAATVNLNDVGNVTSIIDLEVCLSGDEICAKTQEELEENEIKITDLYNVVFTPNEFAEIFEDPTDPDFVGSCDNGLCFWGNPGEASLAITAISEAINGTINGNGEIPPLVTGEFTFEVPGLPPQTVELPSNLYRVPLSFDGVDNLITSRQGTNNGDDPENPWILDTIVSNDLNAVDMYADFAFLGREITRPIPPETPNVPEPSSLMGIVFMASSMLIAMKKKN
ncbi:MAG: PEP-CTERM sorting domain-containing protein [Crocosphaera sp.]